MIFGSINNTQHCEYTCVIINNLYILHILYILYSIYCNYINHIIPPSINSRIKKILGYYIHCGERGGDRVWGQSGHGGETGHGEIITQTLVHPHYTPCLHLFYSTETVYSLDKWAGSILIICIRVYIVYIIVVYSIYIV